MQGQAQRHSGLSLKLPTRQLTRPPRCPSPVAATGSVVCFHYAAPSHAKEAHPESPLRVEFIVDYLRKHRWKGELRDGTTSWSGHEPWPEDDREGRAGPFLHLLDGGSRTATLEELALIHPPGYVEAVQAACAKLQEPTLIDDSTYLAPESYEDCARSVGAALDVIDLLLVAAPGLGGPALEGARVNSGSAGNSSNTSSSSKSSGSGSLSSVPGRPDAAFALVRPPGHHVLPGRPMGFGVFNTVSVAAKYARERHGVGRIAIIDFDVHHGNGTQEAFYSDPDTLYISTHQAGLWPYTGKAREGGSGAGRGATINIPLPGGSGNKAMRQAWSHVVLPAVDRFAPELLLVSAGYDAHWRDPLAGMQLTAGTYHWMCGELLALSQRWCPGRLALILEGGYDCPSLAESVAASLEGLQGLAAPSAAPPPSSRDLYEEPMGRVVRALEEVCRQHGL